MGAVLQLAPLCRRALLHEARGSSQVDVVPQLLHRACGLETLFLEPWCSRLAGIVEWLSVRSID